MSVGLVVIKYNSSSWRTSSRTMTFLKKDVLTTVLKMEGRVLIVETIQQLDGSVQMRNDRGCDQDVGGRDGK